MGLFSKKKEPVKMNSSFNSLVSMNSPSQQFSPNQNSQDELARARAMFGTQAPQFSQSQVNRIVNTSFSNVPPPPKHMEENESVFMQGVHITKQADLSGMQEGDDFHLPDFEESDLKELSQMSGTENVQPISEPKLMAPKQPSSSPFFVQSEEIKLMPPQRQIQIKQSRNLTSSPSFIMGERDVANVSDKYLEMRTFFSIKEKIEESKIIARESEEAMAAQHYRLRSEDYESLARTLNDVQQKLMIIESKVFSTNNPEVN